MSLISWIKGSRALHSVEHDRLGIGDASPGNPRAAAAVAMVDWSAAGVSIGTPTTGWSVTVDSTVKYNGFSSLKVHTSGAAPGGGTTLIVTITIPSTNFGQSKRLGFSVRPGNRAEAAGASYAVQFWLPSSGGVRLYAVPGDFTPDQEWGEYVAQQGDFSTLYNLSGSGGNWSAADADRTSIQLVMTCVAGGISDTAPVYISPIYGDIGKRPSIVSLFMDGPYASQFKYLRPLLKSFDFRATMGVVVPSVGTGAFMTSAQLLKMCEAGHVPIHHTGAGSGVGWNNTTKYPDATVASAVAEDIAASWSQFTTWGYTSGIGYGGVGWSNGIPPTDALTRRLAIISGARSAGMIKMAHSDVYRGPYFGNKENGLMVNSITQFSVNGAYSTGIARLHDLCARGGWTGFRFHELKTSGGSGTDVHVADATFFLEALAEMVDAGKCVVLPFNEAMPYLDKSSIAVTGGY